MAPPRIVLGRARTADTTPQAAEAVPPSPARSFSLGEASLPSELVLGPRTEKGPAVRPGILIGSVLIMVVGVAIITFGGGASNSTVDVERVLSQYESYLARGGTAVHGPLDAAKRQLGAISYLEDAGRIEEARRAWAALLVTCVGANRAIVTADIDNPICAAAERRLRVSE